MDAEYFRTVWDYCYWARDRLLAATEGLSEEEYAKPNGFVYGSIRGILAHTLGGEAAWLARWQDGASSMLGEAELPTLAALRSRWAEEEAKMRAFVGGLSEAGLARDVKLRRRDGTEGSWPLWQLLAHVVNHTTQHRSEAAEALTLVGRSPGNLDMLFYFAERNARS